MFTSSADDMLRCVAATGGGVDMVARDDVVAVKMYGLSTRDSRVKRRFFNGVTKSARNF